jgi:peroxiredoxin Q/BCP
MFGKKYMGIDRSTFVIKDGVIAKEWRKVKITNHVKEVFEFCQSL